MARMPFTKTVERPDGTLRDIELPTLSERIERDVNAIRQGVVGILIVLVIIALILIAR
jgi:hypothetical protein